MPLYIGVGSGLFVLALVVLIAIVLPRSPQSSSGSGKFTKTVNIDDATTISVEYDRDRIYIPLNTDYHDCVPYENLWIDVEITRSGNRVEPTAGLFNMDGKPVEVTCKSSNPSICGCISGGGRAVALRPKSPGKCSISVEFMGKEVKCDFEFMQVPLRVFDDDHEPQKTVELIKLIGFPDEKKRVFAEEPGEKVDGFPHQLTGVYEHWRYKKYPGLIIATSSDMVIGIMTE
ncbi:MAG: hypothetical protein SGJ20_07680 [Planctomycetota bacterium]|nr:hypothetical protein [Planctomycetota bacterium]